MADIQLTELWIPVATALSGIFAGFAATRLKTQQQSRKASLSNEQFFTAKLQELFDTQNAIHAKENAELKAEIKDLRDENEQLKNEIRKLLGELQCYRHIVEGMEAGI